MHRPPQAGAGGRSGDAAGGGIATVGSVSLSKSYVSSNYATGGGKKRGRCRGTPPAAPAETVATPTAAESSRSATFTFSTGRKCNEIVRPPAPVAQAGSVGGGAGGDGGDASGGGVAGFSSVTLKLSKASSNRASGGTGGAGGGAGFIVGGTGGEGGDGGDALGGGMALESSVAPAVSTQGNGSIPIPSTAAVSLRSSEVNGNTATAARWRGWVGQHGQRRRRQRRRRRRSQRRRNLRQCCASTINRCAPAGQPPSIRNGGQSCPLRCQRQRRQRQHGLRGRFGGRCSRRRRAGRRCTRRRNLRRPGDVSFRKMSPLPPSSFRTAHRLP